MEPDEKRRLIDEWTDRALTQYGQAEPRPGLENRVLARLQVERERSTGRKWRWQPALAAVTAILTISISLFVTRGHRHNPRLPIAKENSAPVEVSRPDTSAASKPHIQEAAKQRPHSRVPRHALQSAHAPAPARLDQFPSPEPLSEQEKILARYVQQFPREADLTAQFQTEFARREMLAEQAPPESEISSSSEAQNR